MDEQLQALLDDTKAHMDKSLVHLEAELVKIRAGKASPAMIDGVTVDYYGSETPINQVATVSTPDSRTITVSPWEKKMIPTIEKAIRDANLGFNPQSDGEMVRVPIPALNEERRKQLVKQVHHEGENARIAIRHIRKDSNDKLKKFQDEGTSEDMVKRAEKEVQDLTDNFNHQIEEVLKHKEEEIMTV